jgi:hypothetical protein
MSFRESIQDILPEVPEQPQTYVNDVFISEKPSFSTNKLLILCTLVFLDTKGNLLTWKLEPERVNLRHNLFNGPTNFPT